MQDETGSTRSVQRAASLLDCFVHGQPRLRVADITRMTDLNQSTVSRQLATLEQLGLLNRDDEGHYRLGTQVLTLAGVALNDSDVHRAARGVAYDLSRELGLGANVAQRSGAELLWLMNFDGRHAPRSSTLMGRRGPLHATGLGKALLSGLAPEAVEALLEELTSFTPNTLTDWSELHAALEHVRSYGYAFEMEELAFGRACVAAPIRDRTGDVVAAISISGPLSALDLSARRAELANRIIEAADTVSVALGFVPQERAPAASH